MPLDSDDLAALSKALADSVSEKVSNSLGNSLGSQINNLEQMNKTQAENLQVSVDGILGKLLKVHEAFEVKTDERFKTMEEAFSKRQDVAEKKNEDQFCDIQKQLSTLHKAVNETSGQFPSLPTTALPPHPGSLPQPTFARILQPSNLQQTSVSPENLLTIKNIVSHARTIIGLGPITASDIEGTMGNNPADKLQLAAIDFLRNEIGVKEDEIKDVDIIKVFPADDPNLQRVYAQFRTNEQAELCMNLTRKLRKPDLKVVLFIPNQFKQRFHALKNEDFRLRKLTTTKHKTRIEYSEDDLNLYICPVGHFRFEYHPVPGLPPVDLAPVRTPPPGRKPKRTRSESSSPKDVEKKKERVEEIDASSDAVEDLTNVPLEITDQQASNDLN
jgi:hypothetical protein